MHSKIEFCVMKITEEEFREIMDGESDYRKHNNICRITQGLNIITKYTPKFGIEGAEHDVVYSVDVEKIIDAGITKEDAITLSELGWLIDSDNDCLYHFA